MKDIKDLKELVYQFANYTTTMSNTIEELQDYYGTKNYLKAFYGDILYDLLYDNNAIQKQLENDLSCYGQDNDIQTMYEILKENEIDIYIEELEENNFVVDMAKEIAELRKNNDLEWGEFCGNKDYYDYKKIIEEFKNEVEDNE